MYTSVLSSNNTWARVEMRSKINHEPEGRVVLLPASQRLPMYYWTIKYKYAFITSILTHQLNYNLQRRAGTIFLVYEYSSHIMSRRRERVL